MFLTKIRKNIEPWCIFYRKPFNTCTFPNLKKGPELINLFNYIPPKGNNVLDKTTYIKTLNPGVFFIGSR
jgi:hypothetical protein